MKTTEAEPLTMDENDKTFALGSHWFFNMTVETSVST
ncbi:hypothetical protein TCAL_15289 [Tigriopus californicus]|uniref:Uncharacterized protein n=1 Tax=Tigriopus californicus TaxID=6832 RepID=A0A553PLZ1_TIGCA|nr:hypothetical protein TCAL_15289 [Tigriopus californicus]